jgi:hypothetical protein
MGNASLKTTVRESAEVTDVMGAPGLTALEKTARCVPTVKSRLVLNRISSTSTVRPFTGGI